VIINSRRHIVATGYNGSLPGAPHCDDVGHLMHDGHCVRTVHAESNAIAQAALGGQSTDGCTIFVTTHPCPTCLKLIASAGIKHVIFMGDYHEDEDSVSTKIAAEAKIRIDKYTNAREQLLTPMSDEEAKDLKLVTEEEITSALKVMGQHYYPNKYRGEPK
jgi:dCMP deaminase